MPYYEKIKLLFIHIPKTGGTKLEIELKKTHKCKETLYSLNKLATKIINMQHFYYTTIYNSRNKFNINFDNIKIISFVRNPYDRIISDLFWFRLIKKDSTNEEIYSVIKNNYLYRDNLDNHNIPQYKFVTDKNNKLIKTIKIFKTETLNQSNDELSKFIGLNINIQKSNVNKDYSKYLNKESISLINDFYKTDFELFNYKLK